MSKQEHGTTIKQRLASDLDGSLVAYRKAEWGSVAYLKTATVIRQANEIFGYGNWKTELLSPPTKVGNGYMAVMRVTVKSGEIETSYEDVGYCPSRREGDESTAVKGAVSDALKRCLRHFGPQFGNDLYTEDSEDNKYDEDDDDFDSQLQQEPEELLCNVSSIEPTDGTGQAKWEITLDNGDVLPYYGDTVPVEEGNLAKVIITKSKKGNRYIKSINPVPTGGRTQTAEERSRKSEGRSRREEDRIQDEDYEPTERPPSKMHPRVRNQLVRITQHSLSKDENDILELFDELSNTMFGVPCLAIHKDKDIDAFVSVLAQCKDEGSLIDVIEEMRQKTEARSQKSEEKKKVG